MPGADCPFCSTKVTPWRIKWDDRTYTDDDLTGAHATDLGMLLGFDWAELNPWKDALHTMSFIAVLKAHALGLSEPEEFAKILHSVKTSPLSKIADALNPR